MTITWQTAPIGPGLRFDCCENLGGTVRLAASRSPTPGLIFRADDVSNWRHVATVGTKQFTAIASGGGGVVYIVDEDARVYRSIDWGDTWTDLGQVSSSTVAAVRSYGIWVTATGTVLMSDCRTAGGKIWRSTNAGTSWADLGAIGTDGLYVFTSDGSTILISDFSGRVHKSTDDGATWSTVTTTVTGSGISEAAWGLAVISSGVWCVAHESGKIYRTTNSGGSWSLVYTMGGAADYMGTADGSRVICSTYTNGNVLYESTDGGVTWATAAAIPTQTGDYLSRGVRVGNELFGTTEQGYAIYSDASIPDFTSPLTLWDVDQVTSGLHLDASDSASLFDATSGGSAVAADGTIARAEDQSGNTRHVTQSTSGKRPLRKTVKQNALDVMRFDGTDDSIGIASTNLAQNAARLWVFAVAKITAPSTTDYKPLIRWRTGADTDRAGLYVRQSKIEAGGRRADADSYQFVQHGTALANQTYVFGAFFDWTNAALTAYLSGAGTARSGGFQTSGTSGNTEGRMDIAGHLTSSLNLNVGGDICEIFVTTTAIDLATQQKIEGRLHHKWGIQYLLPFDHPYKHFPPFLSNSVRRQCPQCLGLGVIA